MKSSVLIVEDRVHTAESLRRNVALNPNLAVCGVAYDLDSGLNQLQIHRPRIVLTDLGLPDGSGLELIQEAAKADWACDILVVSIFGDERRVCQAIRAGAKGYIHKNDSAADIGNCIMELINGGSPMSPKVARILLSMVGKDPEAEMVIEGASDLSERELEVMGLIAKGFKRREVADNLAITVGTVGNHVHKIYSKLGVNSNTEAIVAATRKGLI
ncbi:MAG: response regulator [Planktomarina sp.]